MVSDHSLLSFACSDLLTEVLSQPICKLKSSLSMNEIECAVNSLGWENTIDLVPVRNRDNSENIQLSRDQVQQIWMQPFPPCKRVESLKPQVYIYHPSDWKSSGSHEDDQSSVSGPSSYSDISSALPDGIREFIRQVENMYSEETAAKTQKDILESLASSEHMPICFPYLVKFAVDRIRTVYRRDGETVLKLLELVHHILCNKHFDLTGTSTSGIFDLLVGCFVMLITDVNLLSHLSDVSMQERIRKDSIGLLRELLESKIGKYHSIALIEQLIDGYLIPLILVTRKRLVGKELTEELRHRLRGVLDSACSLIKELVDVNESKLGIPERLSVLE